jgi:hypothetical protein
VFGVLVGELVGGYTSVRNKGGQFRLLNITKRVKDLLQVTKLYTFSTYRRTKLSDQELREWIRNGFTSSDREQRFWDCVLTGVEGLRVLDEHRALPPTSVGVCSR